MSDDFPYQPGYVGELDAFSPQIAADLERLLQQLDPQLLHPVTQDVIPYFRSDDRFRQIIAVEELDGSPAIVGTANISLLRHSYDKNGALTDTPAFALGSFVVDENMRGKGIAGKIWDALLKLGRARNIHLMQFTSRPARSAAHSFYAKMGAEQFAPIKAVKYKAAGTEVATDNFLPCDEQLELAKGHVVFVFSEARTQPFDEKTARSMIAQLGADRFEQLIPTDNPGDATTVLFSVTY